MKKSKGSSAPLRVPSIFSRLLALGVSVAVTFSPVVTTSSAVAAAKKPPARDFRDRDEARDRDADFGKDHDQDSDGGCRLQSARGEIKHVVFIQFDNVHFERDNPNVPSDLEQMPNLLNFMKDNGTLLTDSHTPLISHTADDIITSLTGVYGDRHGIPVANSFGYFPQAGSSTAADLFSSSFAYWTDRVNTATLPTDPSYIMATPDGKNAPAPWVPFTRAGCNVGAVSIANMEFENITSDIFNVFPDPTSAPNIEAKAATTTPLRDKAIADFEGIAIHCAAANTLCSTANGSGPDVLPQEPGGYSGFSALYGHKYAVPAINGGSANLNDLNGNLITDGLSAPNGPNTGFPGFGGISAAQTLSYVAQMQEHGVPVTFAYISDAHDSHAPGGQAFGPGQAGYVAQLKSYNDAFGKFFARLKSDGIDQTNTLFLITTEEQDHFAGGPPSPANCDGVNIPCTYAKIGEIDANLTALLNAVDANLASTPFDIHFDMAPVFYINGNPAPAAPITREYERATGKLTAISPITGNLDNLTVAMADPVELKLLHMITGDPQRTPSFVMFGDPDYFFQTFGTPTVAESPAFAWNHGGIQPEITTTWVGLVGPGVSVKGTDNNTFADETDYRPTILSLAGLKDDYQSEGRVLVEEFKPWAVPDGVHDSGDEFLELARAFKQINAPLGQLAKDSLKISTAALNGKDINDVTYTTLENEIANITVARDTLVEKMTALLEKAEFNGGKIDEREERALTRASDFLLDYVHNLAGGL